MVKRCRLNPSLFSRGHGRFSGPDRRSDNIGTSTGSWSLYPRVPSKTSHFYTYFTGSTRGSSTVRPRQGSTESQEGRVREGGMKTDSGWTYREWEDPDIISGTRHGSSRTVSNLETSSSSRLVASNPCRRKRYVMCHQSCR